MNRAPTFPPARERRAWSAERTPRRRTLPRPIQAEDRRVGILFRLGVAEHAPRGACLRAGAAAVVFGEARLLRCEHLPTAVARGVAHRVPAGGIDVVVHPAVEEYGGAGDGGVAVAAVGKTARRPPRA